MHGKITDVCPQVPGRLPAGALEPETQGEEGQDTQALPQVVEDIRGTSALHSNEPTWIIDGFNELIVDFLFALVIFLDSTQPWPLKSSK